VKQKLSKVLVPPKGPNKLSNSTQWLAREGTGSWFEITLNEKYYSIKRYSDVRVLECTNLFKPSEDFDLHRNYKITYPSHCAKVTVIQNLTKIVFNSL